jgi:DNA-binding LacI/PurR family transcriptional regulator
LLSIDHNALPEGIVSVCFDNEGAGKQLAKRLCFLGHRRILAIFEDPEKPAEKQDEAWPNRRIGFLRETKKHPRVTVHELFIKERSTLKSIQKTLLECLGLPSAKRPTALFLPMADELDKIRKWAAACGLRIPRDLTVLSCCSKSECPELSGFRFEGATLGTEAIRLMIQRMLD